MRRFLGYILLLLCPLFVWADGSMWWNTDYNTTEGTEFYVTFMVNVGKQVQDDDLALYLFATARQNANIQIQGIQTDYGKPESFRTYSASFTVPAGGVDSIKIPNEVAYLQQSNQTENSEWLSKGIRVTSDKPISLYSLNANNASYDVSLILPVNGINKEYVIQTLSRDNQGTEFAIVSAANGNSVKIHLLETEGTTTTAKDIDVYLNQGQSYCYRPATAAISLTGTTICADKPISVFQGGQHAAPPKNDGMQSHIYEQAFSTDYWGKTFCVTRTYQQECDVIRITASEDDTKVYENNTFVTTLNSLETYEKKITWLEGQQAIVYTTSKAVECNLYATASLLNYKTRSGSPAMTAITPQEQGIRSIILAPFDETRTKELNIEDEEQIDELKKNYLHFVNVVTKTTDVEGMRLDGTNISSLFSPIGTSDYSSACIQITTGSHILENSSASFTVRNYGLFVYKEGMSLIKEIGYACSGGSNTHHNAYFLIDGQRIKDKTICVNHPPLTFTSVISYDYDKVYWLFDDIGTTTPKVQNSRGDSIVTRSYTTQGIDNVCMVVERITPLCQNVIRDTIRATIHVKDTYQSTFSARACKGETVPVIGRDIQGKQYTINYTTDVDADSLFYTINGCDSIVHIDIKFGEPKNTDISATACGQYTWHGTTYKESGIYQWVGKTAYGCDSIVNLNLIINQPVNGPIEQKTICEKSSLSWNGLTITKAGTYHATLQAQNGCDSLCTIEVTIEKLVTETTNATICNEDSFEWRGKTYYQSDTITEISPSPCGCDSTLILQLVVLPKYDDTIPTWICEEDSIFFVDTYYRHEGIYTHHLKSAIQGCDSMVTLDLHIYPNEDSVRYDTTCSNHPYLFDGKELTQSGIYTMKQNTAQGCEQLITLHLVVYQVYDSLLRDTICAGETYYWEGSTYTKAGVYHKDYKTIHGCDSIMRLELTVNDAFHTYIDTTWCSDNDIYNHPDERATKLQNLTETGTYIDTIPTTHGCDSILTLNLKVIAVVDTTIYDTICSNEYREFNGKQLNETGIYTMPETIGTSCSRIVTLQLVVHPAYDITTRDTICAGDTCYWEGRKLTKSGTYDTTYQTIHGCDSVMKLELTMMPTYSKQIDVTWCSNEGPYNHPDKRADNLQNRTETGTYIDTIPSIYGCDSILTLNLKVIAVADTTIYDTICSNETYLFGKDKLNKTGTYYREDTIGGSCYRLVTLELEVYQAYDSLLRDTICAGDTCYWEERKLTKSGTYDTTYQTIHGCDSVMKLELTVMPTYSKQIDVTWCSNNGPYNHPDKRADNLQNRTETGTYIDTIPSIYGCDSILTLNLKVIAVADTIIYDTICSTDSIKFGDEYIKQAGPHTREEVIESVCSRTVTLQLVVYPAYDITTRDTICAGDTCYWEERKLTKSGTYDTTYQTIHGCDSVMKLELTVMPTYSKQIDVTWCSNEGPYNHPDKRADNLQNRTETGTYIDTIPSIYGCDSILILNLTVIAVADTIIYDTICSNEYREFNGKQLNETGIYTMPETIGTSCSRIVTLQLVVHPAYDITTRDTICAGDTCYWEERKLTKSGTYDTTYQTIHGCDSIMKLELTVMPTYNDPVVYDEWCAENGPYYYFDKRADNFQGLTKTGEYKDTLQTIYGCDSIITLDLKVWPNYVLSDTTHVSICDNEPYLFQGTIYNQHGEWKTEDHSIRHDTLFGSGKSIHGCDSSFVHIVTTYPTYEFVSTQRTCSGDTVYWEGRKLTETGIYEELKHTIHGCDSLLVLNLYVKPVVRKKRYLSGCEDTVFIHNDTIRNGSREVIIPTTLWDPFTNPQDVILHKEHTELVDVTYPSKDGTCDSIVYEYHIHLFPIYINEKEVTFCSNEMYPINSIHEVGIDTLFDYRDNVTPIDTTFRDTLPTITGCDSVFVLKAHILPASIHKQQDSICFGEELNWCEQIIQKGSGEYQYPNAGDYIFRYTYEKENGCDSIIELHLTVMPTYIDSIYQEWCSKDGAYNYPCAQALKLQELTETGVYRDTLLAISGCDSILVVNLHIFNNEDIEVYDTICSNDHYEFDNTLLTQSGIYQKTELLPNGCPQTTILNLTVYPAYEDTTEVTICYGDTCFWEDSTYTIEGEYIEHKYTVHGCDSILHLLLFIEPDYNTYTTDSICQGEQYLFDDEWINESGDYVHSNTSILGCDSSHYMTLIVFDTVATFDTTTICNNELYDFYGQTITEEGTYRKSSLTEHGCSLNNYLTVYVIPPTIAHVSVEPLCADQEAFEVDFTYEGTQPIAYSLLYDSIGHSQGFVDIRHQLLESDSVIVVATPFRDGDTTKYPRPDHYPITLILHNGICQNDSLYPSQTDIIMNYPSWVTEQRFGDLIAILNEKYNGGYTFDKYQWFENGQMMIGETRPYLYLPHKLELVEYYVELTRTGETEAFQTCPILIVPDQLDTIAPRLPYISVTPTYISSENPKANILSWTPGKYIITDVMGNHLKEGNYTPDTHNAYEIEVPSTPNVYIIYMEETDAGIYSQIPHEKNRSQKIIVY